MTIREENPHAGGKWETMNLLRVALCSTASMGFELNIALSSSKVDLLRLIKLFVSYRAKHISWEAIPK